MTSSERLRGKVGRDWTEASAAVVGEGVVKIHNVLYITPLSSPRKERLINGHQPHLLFLFLRAFQTFGRDLRDDILPHGGASSAPFDPSCGSISHASIDQRPYRNVKPTEDINDAEIGKLACFFDSWRLLSSGILPRYSIQSSHSP
jgi:hypothetical protein